jgi:hypothetical protein
VDVHEHVTRARARCDRLTGQHFPKRRLGCPYVEVHA